MSLLMQALKKAERSKLHALPDEDATGKPSEAFDEVLALTPQDLAQERFQVPSPELTLQPLDAPAQQEQQEQEQEAQATQRAQVQAPQQRATHNPALDNARDTPQDAPQVKPQGTQHNEQQIALQSAQIPPLTPAQEAPHDPTPPQARVGAEHAASSASHGRDAGPGPRMRATARAAAEEKLGRDPARTRLAVLAGILLLLVALFGYLFWHATTSPGPGASLPMVPMPAADTASAVPGAVIVAPGTAADIGAGAAMPENSPAEHAAATTAGAAQRLSPGSAITLATPSTHNAGGASGMLGPARSTPPSGNTVMATPEEIEQAMLTQAGQQGGSPPPFAAPAPGTATATATASPDSVAANSARRTADPSWSSGDITVSRSSSAARVNPALQAGYQALLAGELPAASEQYAAALRQEPNNRDALLGSAAVALRRSDAAQAAAAYTRLLELDPNDGEALAGLLSLRPGDNGQSEQRLKALLRKTPDAAAIQFALGNLYARQGRWSEAQQAYFRAYGANPEQPDYAVNLAIGLDRLNQPGLALTYYQRALALSRNAPAGFDAAAVRARMRQLGAPE